MTANNEAIDEKIQDGCLFSHVEIWKWTKIGKSYFIRVPYTREAIPTCAERIELNKEFMVFAFYRVGKKGEEKVLGYEVRPLVPPELEVVGAALFLRYCSDDNFSPGGHTKSKVGDKHWPLIMAQYENGDVMFTLR